MKVFLSIFKKMVLSVLLLTVLSSCDFLGKVETPRETIKASFTMEAVNSAFTGKTTDLTIYKNETVQFTNTSTEADSYLWDFGDGGTSTQKSPSHTYNKCGTYYATLTINKGEMQSKEKNRINVTSKTIEVTTVSATCTKFETFPGGKYVNGTKYYYAYTIQVKGSYYGYMSASKWKMWLGSTYSYWDAKKDEVATLVMTRYTTKRLQDDLYLFKYLKLKARASAESLTSQEVFGDELYVLWNVK